MKYLYALTLILIPIIATAQSWEWVKAPAGASSGTTAKISSLSYDGMGHVYAVGFFDFGVIDFGSVSVTNPLSVGSIEILVVKYDTLGNVIWARTAPVSGIMENYCTSVATDAFGNVYVTGFYEANSITFGSTSLLASGYGCMFIAKYDSSGTVLWAKNGVDYGASVEPQAVTVGYSGNVYTTGKFGAYYATFGTDTLYNLTTYQACGFLIKCSPTGTIIWKKRYGGFANSIVPGAITTDAQENIYVSFRSNDTATMFESTAYPTKKVVLAKYDSSGNIQWVITGGAAYNDWAGPVVTDASGNIYWSCVFQDATITLGGFTLTNSSIPGNTDFFIVKCDSSGAVLAARSAGSALSDNVNSMTTDVNGGIYVTGSFSGPAINFGPDTLAQSGTTNIYVAKYDSTLTPQWAKKAGGTNNDQGLGICSDRTGNLYVGGIVSSDTAYFGTHVTTGSFTTNYDLFMSKLNNPIPIFTTHVQQPADQNDFSIYPNPTQGKLNVSATGEISDVCVVDLVGRTVLAFQSSGNNIQIDLSMLPPASYILKINGTHFARVAKD